MTSIIWGAYLTDHGPNRQKVILEIKQLLGISFQEIKQRLESKERILLGTGSLMFMSELRHVFEKLGATVLVTDAP